MNRIPAKILDTLTEEQRKRIETAKTPEELLAIAKETGYELSEEQLNTMAGGWCPLDCGSNSCPDDFDP